MPRGRCAQTDEEAEAERVEHSPAWTLREGLVLAAILLLGLGLRLWYLSEILEAPDFTALRQDLDVQDYQARALLSGDWPVRAGVTDPHVRVTPYYRPPGYTYYLALVYLFSGGSYLAPRLLNMTLGLASAVLMHLLGRGLYGRRAGLIAAFLTATYWGVLYNEGEVNDPALFVFLVPCLILLLRWWSVKMDLLRAGLTGLLVGFYALMRPNILLFGPFMAAWMLYCCWRRGTLWRAVPSWAGLALMTFAAILPVTVRNYVASGELVPISTYFGENLLIGNAEDADGVTPWLPYLQELEGTGQFSVWVYGNIVKGLGREVGRPDLSHSEASSIFARKALDYISAHKLDTLRLARKKAVMFWHPVEITGNKVIQCEKEHYAPLKYLPGFPMVSGLFFCGLLRLLYDGLRGRWRETMPAPGASRGQMTFLILSFIFVYYVSFLPFFVNARARAPLVGLFFLVGAYGLHRLWRDAAARHWRHLGLWAAGYAVAFVLVSVHWYPYKADEARWYYGRADSWLRTGEVEKAAREAAEMLALPTWAPYMPHRLGMAFSKLERHDLAVRLLRAASDPRLEEHVRFYDAGRHLVGAGYVPEGRAEYEKAVAAKPDYAPALNNLALLCEGADDYDSALEYLHTAVEAQPEFALAHSNLAALYERLGRQDLALQHFEKALAAEPEQQDHHFNVARMLAVWGRPDEAIARYEAAIAMNPEDPRALNNLGLLYAEAKDLAKAEAHYLDALRVQPRFVIAYANLGNLYADQGKLEQGIAVYEKGLETVAEDAGLHSGLGYLLAKQGNPERAMAHYEKALSIEARFPVVHVNRGDLLREGGEPAEAEAAYRKALRIAPGNAKAHARLADLLASVEGKADEAAAHYTAAMRGDPKNPSLPNDLANLLVRQGALAEGIAYYRSALQIEPTYASAHINLGVVLARQGDLEGAIAHLRRALALAPGHEVAQRNLERVLAAQREMRNPR